MMYFLYMYVYKLGALDGYPGWCHCVLRASYRYLIDIKVYEYGKTGSMPRVEWPRRGAPDPRIVESALQRQVDGRE